MSLDPNTVNFSCSNSDFIELKPKSEEIRKVITRLKTSHLEPMKITLTKFVVLMRVHINMEEGMQFPFIKRHLTSGDISEISKAFKEVHGRIGSEQIIKQIDEITFLKDILKN